MKKVVLFALLCGVVFLGVNPTRSWGQFFFSEDPLQGKPAPDFTLKTTQGMKLSMSQYRNNQNALIFFWATWCPHCRTELKELSKKKTEFEQKGIKIIVVNLEEKEAKVKSFLNKNKINLNVFLDVTGGLTDTYSIIGVPTIVLVNKQGQVVLVEHSIPKNLDKIFAKKL